ncbi:MAG: ATPase [Bacteroidales bacterium]|nr:ATPase [Bacteroidales bacterium]
MAIEINPFIVTGIIEPEYFCDRVRESEQLIKSLTNGNNVVLISPRRMGKTGLIQFCYEKSAIKDNYYTFYIDILNTTSLREFTFLLGRSIYDTLLPRSRKIAGQFLSALKSVSGKIGFDVFTGSPVFNVTLGDIERPEYTLEEIFGYLSEADKPCIMAIDEFQQTAKYPEKNIEALLRSHIQKIRNANFIFAGSEAHMMEEMFLSSARPFYQSADLQELGPIAKEVYVPFITGLFEKNGRAIATTDVEKVYDLFKGHTFYVHKTFNEAYSITLKGGICTIQTIQTAIDNILERNAPHYRQTLSDIPERQKELLLAIAKESEASQITSAAFLRRHSLASASSVQAAALKLIEREIITETEKVYRVSDRFFALWINSVYDIRLDLTRQ